MIQFLVTHPTVEAIIIVPSVILWVYLLRRFPGARRK